MARKKLERTQGDVREYPCYSIDEVAGYVGVPKRTLRTWIKGYPYRTKTGVKRAPAIIEPADPQNNLLSFYNLVEAQVLAATKEREIGLSKSGMRSNTCESNLVKIGRSYGVYSKRAARKFSCKAYLERN